MSGLIDHLRIFFDPERWVAMSDDERRDGRARFTRLLAKAADLDLDIAITLLETMIEKAEAEEARRMAAGRTLQ
jgi:hypothetical protein